MKTGKHVFRRIVSTAFTLLPCFLVAQVVCTDVNPDITNSGNASLDIDLNNDLTADFRITSAQASTLGFIVVQGSQIGTGNFVLTNGSGGALALPLNAAIGSTSAAWTQMNSTNQQMVIATGTTITGPWSGASDQYLGLALAAGSSTYYGWARFTFSGTSNQYTFKDYAYQSTAGLQILAGESCASVASPKFSLPDSLCAGSTVTVSAQTGTQTPTSYSWASSPGSTMSASSNSVSTVTFGAAGNATVLLYVANSSTSGVVAHTVQVKPLPTVSISPATNTTCAGSTLTLTAAGNAGSFTWSSTPSSTVSNATSQSVVVTPTATSNYVVQAGLNGCTVTASRLLMVTAMPPLSINTTPTVMCADPMNNSRNSATIATGNYSVSPNNTWPLAVVPKPSGGGAIISTTPPYLTSNTVVTLTLTLLYGGCTTQVPHSFSINANPVLTLSPFPSTLCSGHSFTIFVSGANMFSIATSPFSTSISSVPGPSPNFVFTSIVSATYSIMGMLGPGGTCKSATQVNSVTVIPGPTLTVNSPTTCTGSTATLTAGGAETYAWVGPLGPVSSLAETIINAGNSAGVIVYTVTGTDANKCSSKVQTSLTIFECTGLKDFQSFLLSVYPQPVKEMLSVETLASGAASYSIIDATGKKIKEGHLELGGHAATIDVGELSAGFYILDLSIDGQFTTTKLFKQD